MAWIRIAISLIATAAGAFVSWILVYFNGYEEDYGTGAWNTLPLALPLIAVTATVAALTIAAIFDPTHRERCSIWAFRIVLAVVGGLLLIIGAYSLS